MDCKNKRVILQIISAYGFGLIKGSVEVHATLMNKKLQTPTISANNNYLKFASEIIWYMDNATLKKLKMSCASIRVECVHIPINTSSPNQRLGYLLLKLKEAQTINLESNDRMRMKEEQLLKELNNKWFNDRKHIEEELTHEMSKCKALAENLDTMADKLKERETIVTAKELELVYQKDSMDNKYIDLVQNVQFCNAKTINDLNNNICELETKLHNLEEINVLLKKENEQLKYDVNTNCSLQIQQLEKTISSLKSKFDEVNKSCMSYKERWIATVRKINQIYPKFHGNNEHLYNNRKNDLNIMTNQLVEQQHDEEKLRQLLNDLAKLRQDMANTNFLDP